MKTSSTRPAQPRRDASFARARSAAAARRAAQPLCRYVVETLERRLFLSASVGELPAGPYAPGFEYALAPTTRLLQPGGVVVSVNANVSLPSAREGGMTPAGEGAALPLAFSTNDPPSFTGPEFRVNTYTTNHQRTYEWSPGSVASDANGNFVVTWSSSGQDGSGYGVYAQRYSAAGVAVGGEFLVNQYTTGEQRYSAVAMDADGDFVVTWGSNGQDGSANGVYARRYTSAGAALGGEFLVNQHTTSYQEFSAVAMDADGDFVITWSSRDQEGAGSHYGVYARRYTSAGVAKGDEFLVNQYTTNWQRYSTVAMDADGNFVVTWSSWGQDGSNYGVYAQRYSSAGAAVGGEFKVNTYTTNSQYYSTVVMDADGDFVVTWSSDGQDGSNYGVYAQRYSAAGATVGGEFKVNTYTTGQQRFSTVAMDQDGDFVVTWSSNQDGSGYGVYAQRYSAAGATVGGEFKVNTYTTGQQRYSTVAMDADGDFVVTWSSNGQDGSGYGVYAQRFAVVPPSVWSVSANGATLSPGGSPTASVSALTVEFSEPVSGADLAANWVLTRNGADASARIVSFTSGLNASGIYQTVLTLDGPLPNGQYVLTARNTLTDLAGNALDGNADGTGGDDFSLPFQVDLPAVAGAEFRVNTYTTSATDVRRVPQFRRQRRQWQLRCHVGQPRSRRGRQRLGRVRAALQRRRCGGGGRVQGQHVHDGQPALLHGCDGRRRGLRRHVEQLRAGRQRLGHLRPALHRRRRDGGGRVPGQHVHDEHPVSLHGCDGRRRGLRRHVDQRLAGRQQLGRVRPALQRRRCGGRGRVQGQHGHDEQPALLHGCDGPGRRLRCHVGQPRSRRGGIQFLHSFLEERAVQRARRRFALAALALGALSPLSPSAQQPAAVRRIAVLSSSVRSGLFSRALPEDLRRLGYEDGRNIAIEWRFSEGKNERLPAFARELLALNPELIVAHNNEAIFAIKDATNSVPVVMCTGYLPVEFGFVASLGRPGGNITGAVWSGLEQNGKVLQILKEAAPSALNVAVMRNPSFMDGKLASLWKAETDRAARLLGMSLSYFEYSRPDEVDSALAKIAVARPDALFVAAEAVAFARARVIAQFAIERKLVSISNVVVHANVGGLLYYGPSLQAILARTASYVDRILRGAKPADLPIELPATYELVINAKTARAIGYKIPPALLARADRVIE